MEGRPTHWANDSGTAFKNPWPSAEAPTLVERQEFAFPLSWYKPLPDDTQREVKVVTPDWGQATIDKKGLDKDKTVIGTWLGHAGALVEIPLNVQAESRNAKRSLWMLFDPIFSNRSGPNQYFGPARFNKPPCKISDLPGCDVVFISHNHYDHLDYLSIEALIKKFPKAKYFAGLQNKKWFVSCGIPEEQVFELDWWQDHTLNLADMNLDTKDNTQIRLTCVPAQHNCGRYIIDAGATLWCGWIIEHFMSYTSSQSPLRKSAIYHAGDTGYRRTAHSDVICPVFAEIGSKFGPLDLSFIPIWRGGTLGFVSYWGFKLSHTDVPTAQHASPEDAVCIHKDVGSRNTVGIHWGTFVGSEDEQHEAWKDFRDACDKHEIVDVLRGERDIEEDGEMEGVKGKGKGKGTGHNGRAGTLNIGESLVVKLV